MLRGAHGDESEADRPGGASSRLYEVPATLTLLDTLASMILGVATLFQPIRPATSDLDDAGLAHPPRTHIHQRSRRCCIYVMLRSQVAMVLEARPAVKVARDAGCSRILTERSAGPPARPASCRGRRHRSSYSPSPSAPRSWCRLTCRVFDNDARVDQAFKLAAAASTRSRGRRARSAVEQPSRPRQRTGSTRQLTTYARTRSSATTRE